MAVEPPSHPDEGQQRSTRLTCLVEDSAPPPLLPEHGLSFLVVTGGCRVLFDTGQSPAALFHNARALGEDLSDLHAVVLSCHSAPPPPLFA